MACHPAVAAITGNSLALRKTALELDFARRFIRLFPLAESTAQCRCYSLDE
jgi:hypothetical protein